MKVRDLYELCEILKKEDGITEDSEIRLFYGKDDFFNLEWVFMGIMEDLSGTKTGFISTQLDTTDLDKVKLYLEKELKSIKNKNRLQ